MGKEGKEPFLGLTSSLSLSLLFGSLDLRGLEVPKSSKGGWSRVKARASAAARARLLRLARRARCNGRDGSRSVMCLFTVNKLFTGESCNCCPDSGESRISWMRASGWPVALTSL